MNAASHFCKIQCALYLSSIYLHGSHPLRRFSLLVISLQPIPPQSSPIRATLPNRRAQTSSTHETNDRLSRSRAASPAFPISCKPASTISNPQARPASLAETASVHSLSPDVPRASFRPSFQVNDSVDAAEIQKTPGLVHPATSAQPQPAKSFARPWISLRPAEINPTPHSRQLAPPPQPSPSAPQAHPGSSAAPPCTETDIAALPRPPRPIPPPA